MALQPSNLAFTNHILHALHFFAVESYGVLPGSITISCIRYSVSEYSTKVGYHGDILGITVRTV